jgi:hypothetical protein
MKADQHTEWCAHDHRCGLGEHRSTPITVAVPGTGRAVLTRVRAVDGTEHAEICMRVAMPGHEPHAARQRLNGTPQAPVRR